MEVDESGGEARVYLFERTDVAGGVAVKTQRPHRLRPRTSLRKEAALLAALAGELGGRIPDLYGHDRVDTDAGPVEFIAMSQVPGRAAGTGALPPVPRRELLRELTAVLRAVHAFDASDLRADGTLPTVDGAAGLRARLEVDFADLLERLATRRDRWPLDIPADRVADLALAALHATIGSAAGATALQPRPDARLHGSRVPFHWADRLRRRLRRPSRPGPAVLARSGRPSAAPRGLSGRTNGRGRVGRGLDRRDGVRRHEGVDRPGPPRGPAVAALVDRLEQL